MNIKIRIKQKGFTLIELAIVLVIVGVLIGSFIGSLTQRIENSRIAETEDQLKEIKTALIGYVYRKGYMPCPDCFSIFPGGCLGGGTARDGIEDRNGAFCGSNSVGTLPWVTLGLAKSDAWGTRYRYWVDPTYSEAPPGTVFTLTTVSATLGQIDERAPDDTIDDLADSIVAVVISHGKNAYGGITTSSIAKEAIPVANVDEAENVDLDSTFISRPPSGVGATTAGGEFDDILMWITEFELKAKMVEAGRLP